MAENIPPSITPPPSTQPVPPAPPKSEPLADIFSDTDPVAKKSVGSTPLPPPSSSSMPPSAQADSVSKSLIMSRLPIFIGVGVLALAAIGAGVYFLFFAGEPTVDNTIDQEQETQQPIQNEEDQGSVFVPNNIPVDTDGDGLTDNEEIGTYGTNPLLIDSDSDGLSDREEIFIYATDPLNSDTDGDTFSDGDEVRNGYNPKGDGRLFDIPS